MAIGPGVAKAALAVVRDGTLVDVETLIGRDASAPFVTRRDPEARELLRHGTAHGVAEEGSRFTGARN